METVTKNTVTKKGISKKVSALQEFPKEILADPRVKEIGILRCIQCGRCSASCPAAYIYEDFSPRSMMRLLNTKPIDELLADELIWRCGQCFTCHSRCPRNNSPATIIQVMRELASDRGHHKDKRAELFRSIGANLFEKGESVSPSIISQEFFSDMGKEVQTLWRKMPELRKEMGYDEKDARMRPVYERAMLELRILFEATGFTDFVKQVEKQSANQMAEQKANQRTDQRGAKKEAREERKEEGH